MGHRPFRLYPTTIMSEFFIPAFDSVSTETPAMASEGFHPMTLTKREFRLSKNLSPMMYMVWTIDAGPSAGYTIEHYLVFNPRNWSLLKRICDVAGFEWDQPQSGRAEDFVDQFPEGELRIQADVVHEYSIKTEEEGWITVSAEKAEAFDGRPYVKPILNTDLGKLASELITKPTTERAMSFHVEEPVAAQDLPF